MRRATALIALALLATLASGCGLKGPLYLPRHTPAPTPTIPAPMPAAAGSSAGPAQAASSAPAPAGSAG